MSIHCSTSVGRGCMESLGYPDDTWKLYTLGGGYMVGG